MMNIEKETKGSKGSTMGKVRKLQKQYNKILVDLFDQFAAESIEEALEKNEGSFGENIGSIVQCALDCLKTKVLDELGVSGGGSVAGIVIGDMDMTDGMGIMDAEGASHSDDESEEEHEGEETSEEEAEEHSEDESEEDEEDEELEESSPNTDKKLSSSRRGDQTLISEAYSNMYKK